VYSGQIIESSLNNVTSFVQPDRRRAARNLAPAGQATTAMNRQSRTSRGALPP
jgi:hypothetical protein